MQMCQKDYNIERKLIIKNYLLAYKTFMLKVAHIVDF